MSHGVQAYRVGPELLMQALRDPFPARDIEWRVQSSGKGQRGPWVRVLAYITNRAIMDRLDAVMGVDGWRNEFSHAPSGAVLCGLSLLIDGAWITKWDGANETDIEAAKGGLSNAMKRAAVQWGIGRYLYNLEEGYAIIAAENDRTANYLKANPQKHGDALKWHPPKLPAWALPGGSGAPDAVSPTQQQRGDEAEATLRTTAAPKSAPAATSEGVRLPGAPRQLGGYGGKLIVDVPTPDLVVILKTLRDSGKYETIADAVAIELDQRAETGGYR